MRISDWSSDVCSADLSPRHERELPTLLHEHKPSAGKIHPTQQSALNRFPGAHLDEGLAQLASQFVDSTKEFASLQHHDRVGAEPNPIAIDIRELLLDQPLLPSRHRRTDRSEEHTSELQSLMRISYAVFCLKK